MSNELNLIALDAQAEGCINDNSISEVQFGHIKQNDHESIKIQKRTTEKRLSTTEIQVQQAMTAPSTTSTNKSSKMIETINNASSNQYFKKLLLRNLGHNSCKNATKDETRNELKHVFTERAANIFMGSGAERRGKKHTKSDRTKSIDTSNPSGSDRSMMHSLRGAIFEDDVIERRALQEEKCKEPELTEEEVASRNLEKAKKAGRKLLNVLAESPMLYLVKQIVESCADSVRAVNSVGRTPIHMATVHGAPSDVLLYLLQAFPQACQVADAYGRTPLHYLAHSSYWTKEGLGVLWGKSGADFTGPTYAELVRVMVQVHPNALYVEDEEGCNPIEYAIIHNTPLDVVKTMQRASVRGHKSRVKLEEARMTRDHCEANPTTVTPSKQLQSKKEGAAVVSANVAATPLPENPSHTTIGRAA